MAKKLPIPAALIGRLARAEEEESRGLGSLLLADAIKRVLSAAEDVAAYAIVDERGKHFSERHGFIPLPSRPRRLFLLTQTAAAALAQAEGE